MVGRWSRGEGGGGEEVKKREVERCGGEKVKRWRRCLEEFCDGPTRCQ